MKEDERRKRDWERALKAAERARCVACGEKVTPEDRCQDGLYLHRDCAYATSQLGAAGVAAPSAGSRAQGS